MTERLSRDRLGGEEGAVRVLWPRPPFRFDLALAYLSRSPLEALDVVQDGVYRRALMIEGRPRLLEVSTHGGPEQPRLLVGLPDSSASPSELDSAAALVARCFRLDEDVGPLDRLAELDPLFGALVKRLRGLRALIMPTMFEALVWAIIGQQINIAFAYKLKRLLVEHFGEQLEFAGRVYYIFPTPERLARLDVDIFRRLQFSGQKASYIVDLARMTSSGELDLESLRQRPRDEALAALISLRGVGRWTAEYVLMRGLGARDELPAADIGLQAAAARVYALAHRPTEAQLRALAEPWAGWRTYFGFYLWFTLLGDRP